MNSMPNTWILVALLALLMLSGCRKPTAAPPRPPRLVMDRVEVTSPIGPAVFCVPDDAALEKFAQRVADELNEGKDTLYEGASQDLRAMHALKMMFGLEVSQEEIEEDFRRLDRLPTNQKRFFANVESCLYVKLIHVDGLPVACLIVRLADQPEKKMKLKVLQNEETGQMVVVTCVVQAMVNQW